MNRGQSGQGMRTGALRRGLPKGSLVVMGVLLTFLVNSATAQPVPTNESERPRGSVDSRWSPWLGCWDLVLESVDYRDETEDQDVLVCFAAASGGSGVNVVTLAGGDVVLEEAFLADRSRRPVDEAGCRGWRSAEWSRDGHRLFMFSETTCEGGIQRSISGMSFLGRVDEWLDVQVIGSGDLKELVIRQYRRASAEATRNAGFEDVTPVPSFTRVPWARERRLSIDDVIEAAGKLEPAAVEAALIETGASFDLDAAMLIHLADSDVPADVIDLMVALSYPQQFEIDRVDSGSPDAYGGGYGLGFGGYDPYAYWYPFYYAPFGFYSYYAYDYAPYGRYYFWTPTDTQVESSRSRVVKGRGYTRVWPKGTSADGRGGGFTEGGGFKSQDGSSSSGNVSQGGYRSGGSASGRTAKPKKHKD